MVIEKGAESVSPADEKKRLYPRVVIWKESAIYLGNEDLERDLSQLCEV